MFDFTTNYRQRWQGEDIQHTCRRYRKLLIECIETYADKQDRWQIPYDLRPDRKNAYDQETGVIINAKKVLIGLLIVGISIVLSVCVEKELIVDTYQNSIGGIPDDMCVISINKTYIRSICWNYSTSDFLVDVAPLVIDGQDLLIRK